jgi:general secretion pathway protein D
MDALVKLIQETVDPTSWRDAGGTVGGIRPLNGQLIVSQTPENQRLLINLLDQLRETKAIQITIETRFLQVSKNFLEDVGLDLDVLFNLNPTGNFSQISAQQNSIGFTSGPTTGVPGSIGAQTQGASGFKSLQLAGTYLDNFQVNFLLNATQASQTSTSLTAPRVTLFNGQRAYVLVATQRAYVSNLEAVVGNNSSSFQPTIDVVSSGVLLDVQATVSADRKYVTLTLRPQLAQLLNLFTFNFQSATAGAQTGAGGTGGGNINNSIVSFNQASGFVQEPELQITEVRTTVSVPDGGTLLLGGQTLAGEIEKEAGVPILSKIPFLKRLFTNRSMAKDESILLILVKPTIIIQREQEQKQFPLLSSKVTGG